MDAPKVTASDEDNSPIDRIEPPASSINGIQEPIKLIGQLIYLSIIFIPYLLWDWIENLFFKKPKSVKGKVVLVTGAGRGLGQGFAMKFAQLGCKVACADIDETINNETVNMINEKYPGQAKGYVCNVAFSDEIKAIKEAVKNDFNDVDILVHNAGILVSASIAEFEDPFIYAILSVNLVSHFYFIREFLPDMIKRNSGHMVAVGSVASFGALSGASIYAASKHGVMAVMDCLYYELQKLPGNRVKTSLVCPYFVNTSALYTSIWKLRLPELSVEETVEAAVDGILKEKRMISIPSAIYSSMMFCKLLPDRLADVLRGIFYTEVNSVSKHVRQRMPIYRHLIQTAKKMANIFENAEISMQS